jgi:hypothetical protein
MKYRNFPIKECKEATEPMIANGVTVFQKFTCASCGKRNTVGEPNVFYSVCQCECGHTTNIEKSGCNYVLVMQVTP